MGSTRVRLPGNNSRQVVHTQCVLMCFCHQAALFGQAWGPRVLSWTSRTGRQKIVALALASTPWPLVSCNECALCNEFMLFV